MTSQDTGDSARRVLRLAREADRAAIRALLDLPADWPVDIWPPGHPENAVTVSAGTLIRLINRAVTPAWLVMECLAHAGALRPDQAEGAS